MRVVTFASGSSGNCTLLRDGGTQILFDAGISMRRIRAALAQQHLTPQEISAVFITHAHRDHTAGLRTWAKQCAVPIYASAETAAVLRCEMPELTIRLRELDTGTPVGIGELAVSAFPTMHDSPGSVGYTVRRGGTGFGLCTDLGCVTDEVFDALSGVQAAVLEANHDVEMLLRGPYPYPLKRRILSERGHLSNEACGSLAAALVKTGTSRIVLGHLSRENNRPEIALRVVRGCVGEDVELRAAPPDGCLTLEIGAE